MDWFNKTLIFKEADQRLLCRFGSKMCNRRLKCDGCLKYEEEQFFKVKRKGINKSL